MNIFIIGSPWHALIAKVIISKNNLTDVIFLIESLSEASEKQIKALLNGFNIYSTFYHNQTRFVQIKKIGLFAFIKSLRSELNRITSVCKSLLSDYLPSKSSSSINIYYFNFYSPITRKSINVLTDHKNSNIYRVEDGICDYFSFNFMQYASFELFIKKLLSYVLGVQGYYSRKCEWLYDKTSAYYCFFPDKICENWQTKKLINMLNYKDILITYCSQSLPNSISRNNTASSTCLILGQTLYEDGITSLETEIDIYIDVYKRSKVNCVFKPHPRSSKIKCDRLKDAGIIFYDGDEPAEYLLATNLFDYVIGLWSNTIIYARPIYSKTAYTLTYALLEREHLKNKHLINIHNELKKLFPDYYINYLKHPNFLNQEL